MQTDTGVIRKSRMIVIWVAFQLCILGLFSFVELINQLYWLSSIKSRWNCVHEILTCHIEFHCLFLDSVMGVLLQSSGTEFPMIFLHAEIVNYFKDREAKQDKNRDEWFQKLVQSKPGGISEAEQKLNQDLLRQVTPCLYTVQLIRSF